MTQPDPTDPGLFEAPTPVLIPDWTRKLTTRLAAYQRPTLWGPVHHTAPGGQ